MSDSKPFEIRLGLLQLARDVLSENCHLKADIEKSLIVAPSYTIEQIIEEAEKLRAFIEKRT